MTVEQKDVVDFVGIRPDGTVTLTVSDHLDWTEPRAHLLTLQDKINTYLAFVESGELVEKYPNATGKPVEIEVYFKYPPILDEAKRFLESATNVIRNAGFDFSWTVHSPSETTQ